MIGIQFEILNKRDIVLDKILKKLNSTNCIWKILEDEVLNEGSSEFFQQETYLDVEFRTLIKSKVHYPIFLNLQLYKNNSNTIEINNYSDFLKSDCLLILFITDNEFVEIYAKNKEFIKLIEKNAIDNNFSNIKIIKNATDVKRLFSAY